MFDGLAQVACRYMEQNLVNSTLTRPADYCDYNKGKHYIMDDTTKSNSTCTETVPLSTPQLERIVYPDDFVANAKFLGKNHVGQLDCNHFYAPSIKLSDGSYVQMDVWVDVSQGFPCQISTLNLKTQDITTWAFDGFDTVIPHEAIKQCSIPLIMCGEENWVCEAMPNADPNLLQGALGWTCDPAQGKIDCTPINEGGDHYYPNTLQAHCNWAFTAYFLQHRWEGGIDACSFSGLAQIVPPTPPPPHRASKVPVVRQQTRDVRVEEFLHSMTGASVIPYDIVCTDEE